MPALSGWVPLALLSAALYGTYQFCIKRASDNVQAIGAVVTQGTALLIGVVFFLVFAFDRQSLAAARGAPWSLAWAAAAGVAVAGAEIALYYAFSLPNSQVTVGSQLVNGLAIIVAAALAFIFVRGETVNWVKLTSGVLIAGGIVLLSLEKLLVP